MKPGKGVFVCLVAALAPCVACSSPAQRIDSHREAFESLGATTVLIVQAWLAGDVPGTYARTSLDATFRLVEKERTALARRPQDIAGPDGASLSQTAERLSRVVAELVDDVRTGNGDAARDRVSRIPILPAEAR